jgi:glycerol kinase
MSRDLILAIDQGTTGTTALLVDSTLHVIQKTTVEFEQVFPKPGWVEHRGNDIWASLRSAVTKCLASAGKTSSAIAAIGSLFGSAAEALLFVRNSKPKATSR